MKKLLLLALLQLPVLLSYGQECGSFRVGTVCNETPQGQHEHCCACIGNEIQNRNFCGARAPINTGLVALFIGGAAAGSIILRKHLNSTAQTGTA